MRFSTLGSSSSALRDGKLHQAHLQSHDMSSRSESGSFSSHSPYPTPDIKMRDAEAIRTTMTPRRRVIPRLKLRGLLQPGYTTASGEAPSSSRGLNSHRKLSSRLSGRKSARRLQMSGRRPHKLQRYSSRNSATAVRLPWPGDALRLEGSNGRWPAEEALDLLDLDDDTCYRTDRYSFVCDHAGDFVLGEGFAYDQKNCPNGTSAGVEAAPGSNDFDADKSPAYHGALRRLEALVSRGLALTHCAKEDLEDGLECANKTAAYLSDAYDSKDAKEVRGERFLKNMADFLVAFKSAWDEVRTNERAWGQYLGPRDGCANKGQRLSAGSPVNNTSVRRSICNTI